MLSGNNSQNKFKNRWIIFNLDFSALLIYTTSEHL